MNARWTEGQKMKGTPHGLSHPECYVQHDVSKGTLTGAPGPQEPDQKWR